MDDETQKRLDTMVLRTAELNLERSEEEYSRHQQTKAANKVKNENRQKQLRAENDTRRRTSARCNHRQGGTPKNPLRGKGHTALNVVKLPDGFTKLVSCQLCRLRCFSPHPQDGARKPREGETAEQAKVRVKKFIADTAEFERLYEMSRDGLTEESVTEMDCGVTFSLFDGEGLPVYSRRPCDSYALI